MLLGLRHRVLAADSYHILGGGALALGTVAVAAGVVSHMNVATVLTGGQVDAERRRTTALDGCEARRSARLTFNGSKLT